MSWIRGYLNFWNWTMLSRNSRRLKSAKIWGLQEGMVSAREVWRHFARELSMKYGQKSRSNIWANNQLRSKGLKQVFSGLKSHGKSIEMVDKALKPTAGPLWPTFAPNWTIHNSSLVVWYRSRDRDTTLWFAADCSPVIEPWSIGDLSTGRLNPAPWFVGTGHVTRILRSNWLDVR